MPHQVSCRMVFTTYSFEEEKMKNKKSIKLSAEDEDAILDSLKLYVRDELEFELEDFPAKMLLDFLLELIGPKLYNQAIEEIEPCLYERFVGLLEESHALKKD